MHCIDRIKSNHTALLYGFVVLWLMLPKVAVGQEKSVTTEPAKKIITTKGAMLRSALLPGWGQWYNGAKIKSILVFGVEAGLGAGAVVQNQRYIEERYRSEVDVTAVQFYQDSRGQLLWYMGAGYFLNILDAFVDAYLWDFDTSENLSVTPMITSPASMGIRISFVW